MDVSDFIFIMNGNSCAYYYKKLVNYVFYINVGSNAVSSYSSPSALLNDINQYQNVQIEVCDQYFLTLDIYNASKLGFDKLNLTIYGSGVYMKYWATISDVENAYNRLRKYEGLPEINYHSNYTAIGYNAIKSTASTYNTALGCSSLNIGTCNSPFIGNINVDSVSVVCEQKFGGFCKRCKSFDKDAPLDDKGQCFCYSCFQP
jgi:hypothetical protein